MNPYVKIGAAAFLFVALCAVCSVIQSNSVVAQSSATPPAEKTEPATGGMVVHVDPSTGQFLPGPAADSPTLSRSPAEQNAASTSSVGLVEKPAPGGGMMLDLQGRFQSPLVATIDPDGKVTMQHVHEPSHDRSQMAK